MGIRPIAICLLAFSLAVLPAVGVAGEKKHAPLGFQVMCLKYPSNCSGGGAASVAATDSVMATLERVNALVNRSIKARSDGRSDVWTPNKTSGDCEEYVVAKRSALIRAGLPASSLRIAYTRTRLGIGHAILIVKTHQNSLVLDNLTADIKPLSRTGYTITSMSGANPRQWS